MRTSLKRAENKKSAVENRKIFYSIFILIERTRLRAGRRQKPQRLEPPKGRRIRGTSVSRVRK